MEQLVEQAKGGNTIAMWALWEAVERLVKWYANRIHLPPGCGATFEDLVQSGYLALVDAVQGFDLSAGATFTGYLALHLKNAFAQCAGYRKKPDPLQSAASLDAPIPGAEDLRLSDTIPDAVDPYKDTEREIWVQQLHAALEQAISSLDPQEQSTLHARFYDGLSLKETAEREGCSPERVRQREAKAIRRLRNPKRFGLFRDFLEDATPYFSHVGVIAFTRSHTSATEAAVLKREALTERAYPPVKFDAQGAAETADHP
ncbi:MAG: sigma-70 family RNA polymerase sigma factor [Oscillospiraceae bacterium]|jgi:RNA polymerase sigma factor (sigma-70 family)|nr:sigma-70 family RNA polymerase sigma factor [Oscillospiraceae bacterium]